VAINGTGNAQNNVLTGNIAANVLKGGFGNDTLDGGDGNDTLFGEGGNDLMTGGAGADRFTFQDSLGAGNADHVADFATGSDKILLENAIFASLGAGPLAAGAFVVGTAAADASDRIIYDAATGTLFYDSDGSGAGAALLFATLDNAPATLSASDFLVI
jgi:serralysin